MNFKFAPLVRSTQPLFMFGFAAVLLIGGIGRTPVGGPAGSGRPPNGAGEQRPPQLPAARPARVPQQPPAAPNNGGAIGRGVDFPAGYAGTFVQYAVVNRPDNISRLLYMQPASLAGVQSGRPLPDGTTLVIEAYNSSPGADGRLVRGDLLPFIHVAEKIGGQWRFASFTPEGARAERSLPDENPRACADCHAGVRDFVFSRVQIDAFATAQVMQSVVCGKPGRDPCN